MSLTTILNGIRIASALAGQPDTTQIEQKQDIDSTKRIEVGYNALESGIDSDENIKTRALTDVNVNVGPIKVGYNGLNEFSGKLNEYFGMHTPYLGLKDSKLQLVGLIEADGAGVFEKKAGLRYNIEDQFGVTYGKVDLVFDSKGSKAIVFLGKEFGKNSLELYNESGVNHKLSGVQSHTELQYNRNLSDKLSAFVRAEMNTQLNKEGFSGIGLKDTYFVVGLTTKF